MLEEQVLEDRYPDLNEEEDIRMDEIRDEHQRDVAEECDNKNNIHALRWYVYVKEKEELMNRQFSVSVPHSKWGNSVWTCVKDNIIEEMQDYEAIGLHRFAYKLFQEDEGGGVREVF